LALAVQHYHLAVVLEITVLILYFHHLLLLAAAAAVVVLVQETLQLAMEVLAAAVGAYHKPAALEFLGKVLPGALVQET
jgi:hypothetical protein